MKKSKVLAIKVEETHPPLYVECIACKAELILVPITIPWNRIIYMGRCDCAIYYWSAYAFSVEYYSKFMYYNTVMMGPKGFVKTYNGASKVYEIPILTDSLSSVVLEADEDFINPFTCLGSKGYIYYRHFFYTKLYLEPNFRNKVLEMEGKRLFCPNKYHHSRVILEWFLLGCPQRKGNNV